MSAHTLTVAVPDSLLKRLRTRAKRSHRSVEDEVVSLLSDALSSNGRPLNGTTASAAKENPSDAVPSVEPAAQSSEADRILAEAEAELPPDIKQALDRIKKLDDTALRKAVKPIMKPTEAKRLEALNRKAQDKGLIAAEVRERDKLLHLYEKSMVVRATALAELHKRGVDVSELIAS